MSAVSQAERGTTIGGGKWIVTASLARMRNLLPGLLLCGAVTLVAATLERVETDLAGRSWVEALVLAILVGIAIRTAWTPGRRWTAGINFSAKTGLEIAVFLLGASVSTGTMLQVGWKLLLAIAVIVIAALAASYGFGRLLGLRHRMAVLVACGNSICGNSAIAAVAPIIGAAADEIVGSIAFTAILGVTVVLGLPLLAPVLRLSPFQYGVFAGLTVYAVPQVLAAAAPIGTVALQIGTLVKLVRVLMLGPVVLAISLWARPSQAARPSLARLAPWFIIGFLGLAALRSLDLIPAMALRPIAAATSILTILSMAALGLTTDLRIVAKAGMPVVAAAIASLLLLGGLSLGLIRLLGLA